MSTETEWRDKQLNTHYEEEEMADEVSNCCGVHIILGDACSRCKEHCEVTTRGEWMYEKETDARCDEADAKIEMERENG